MYTLISNFLIFKPDNRTTHYFIFHLLPFIFIKTSCTQKAHKEKSKGSHFLYDKSIEDKILKEKKELEEIKTDNDLKDKEKKSCSCC